MNDIVFFVFCCVQGVAFVAVAALLSLKVIARDAIYLHFFWENGYDTSLKGNGINKKTIIIYIDFQVISEILSNLAHEF